MINNEKKYSNKLTKINQKKIVIIFSQSHHIIKTTSFHNLNKVSVQIYKTNNKRNQIEMNNMIYRNKAKNID